MSEPKVGELGGAGENPPSYASPPQQYAPPQQQSYSPPPQGHYSQPQQQQPYQSPQPQHQYPQQPYQSPQPQPQSPPVAPVQSPPPQQQAGVPQEKAGLYQQQQGQGYPQGQPPQLPPGQQPIGPGTTVEGQQYQRTVPIHALQENPAPVRCPSCGGVTLTRTNHVTGNTTYGWAAACCAVFCLGCIPFFISSLKDVQHFCGNCSIHLATWHRSGRTEVHFH